MLVPHDKVEAVHVKLGQQRWIEGLGHSPNPVAPIGGCRLLWRFQETSDLPLELSTLLLLCTEGRHQLVAIFLPGPGLAFGLGWRTYTGTGAGLCLWDDLGVWDLCVWEVQVPVIAAGSCSCSCYCGCSCGLGLWVEGL